jgi:SH3-like domain-containing protein
MMTNYYRNLLILILVFGFLTFAFWSEKTDAQTKTAVKKTPTPKTNAATAKAKPTPKPAPKKQIIVNVTSGRVRNDKNLQSDTLQFADIGTTFTVLEETGEWSKVKLADDKEGWISKTITENFSSANKTKIYNSIADKYLANKKLDFITAANVFYFLKKAGGETDSAEMEFKSYKMLEKVLQIIPAEKMNENPYKYFTEKYAGEIVYSEPAGQWYVNAKRLWELHAKNKNKPVGEDIAWQAAQTSLPGECEGYINCYVYTLRVTEGEYLNFYPAGKHSREALLNITNFLEPINQDAGQKTVYDGPYDISDRAELNKPLAELRTIVSKTPYVEKQKTINQINRIAEAFK